MGRISDLIGGVVSFSIVYTCFWGISHTQYLISVISGTMWVTILIGERYRYSNGVVEE
jgi:hypothetical protein